MSTMTTEELLSAIYSRLNAHEWIIEVMLANDLAVIPTSRSDQFKADLLSREMHLPPKSGPMDLEQLQAIDAAMKVDVADILRKVSAREQNIREIMARGG